MPEVDAVTAREITRGLLELLRVSTPHTCGGIALAPADGNDFEILLVGARAACDRAGPGEVELAAETYRVIEIEGRVLIVADPAMLRMMTLLDRLSKVDLPVLVCGETGTGKELAATLLHRWSARARGPLVVLNCAALPETLAETELFGHEKGAFTGGNIAEDRHPRAKRRRHHLPRRDRRAFARDPGQAPPRPRKPSASRASGARASIRSTCASSPRRTATSPRRSRLAGSARIYCSGSLGPPCGYRRSATAAARFRSSPSGSSPTPAGGPAET